MLKKAEPFKLAEEYSRIMQKQTGEALEATQYESWCK